MPSRKDVEKSARHPVCECRAPRLTRSRAALRVDTAMSDVTPKNAFLPWSTPVVAVVGGSLAGAGSGLSFVALHSHGKRLVGVPTDWEGKLHFLNFDGHILVVISVGCIDMRFMCTD